MARHGIEDIPMTTQPGLLTAEEFAALPHKGLRLELIKGELIAMPPTHGNHGVPAMRLSGLLTHYILTHQLGEVYAAERGFLIAENSDTVRAPDFAFIQPRDA
jgi:Uma2 family endonuclease